MNLHEARNEFLSDKPMLADKGIILDGVESYTTPDLKRDYTIAMDAMPALQTVATGGIPAILTTTIDPTVIEVRFVPNKAVEIMGEQKKGDWLQDTIMFPVLEHVGEVSSYGDYANNGLVNVNMNWPQRQNYLYQSISEYGEREVQRAGLAGINFVAEKDKAAANVMARFENAIYFYGVAGLQNYGILNDPSLGASLTPSTKAAGGTTWTTSSGAPNATANEAYNDVLALFQQLSTQTVGYVTQDDELVLCYPPTLASVFGYINQYNLKFREALQAEFPKMRFVQAVQFGKQTSTFPQGNASGNVLQLWAPNVDGQDTGFLAFSEKMRAHNLVTEMSAYKKKWSGGAWGSIIKQPYAVASMVGV